jgi:hypothetical protein
VERALGSSPLSHCSADVDSQSKPDRPENADANVHNKRRRRWETIGGWVGLIGGGVAVVSAILTWLIWHDSRRINLHLYATEPFTARPGFDEGRPVSPGLGAVSFREGTPIVFGVVNDSHRSANIVNGRVLYKGQEIGRVTSVIPDAERLVQKGINSTADLAQLGSQGLPYEITPGGGRAIAVRWEAESQTPETGAFAKDAVREPEASLPAPRAGSINHVCPSGFPEVSQAIPDFGHAPAKLEPNRLRLVLTFDPGGNKAIDIALQPVYRDDLSSGWNLWVEVSKPFAEPRLQRPRYFVVNSRQINESGIVTMEIWGGRASPIRRMTRPYRASFYSCFPVGDLQTGLYQWVLRVGGNEVAGGLLQVPCLGHGGRPQLRQPFQNMVRASECEPVP